MGAPRVSLRLSPVVTAGSPHQPGGMPDRAARTTCFSSILRTAPKSGATTRRYWARQLMAKSPCRRPDHRPVKVHRNYTIEEAAQALDVHKNTVRAWIRQGLPLIDRKRPFLIHGTDLVIYLQRRRAQNKRPCGAGQIYCMRCRAPKAPAGGMVDYVARTDRTGDLIGLCPDCELMNYRRVSWAQLDDVRGTLEIQIMQPHLRIADSTCPSVTCDFEQGVTRDAA